MTLPSGFDPENMVVINAPDGSPPGPGVDGPRLHPHLAGMLKKHQIVGVRFICSRIFKVNGLMQRRAPQAAVNPRFQICARSLCPGFGAFQNTGCILSDFMGLGKTFQVISSLHAFMSEGSLNPETHTTSPHLVDLSLPAGRKRPKVFSDGRRV